MASKTPSKKKAAATAVVILGMHRSGTSALTRVCNILGVELGDNLVPAAAGNNETGFWEHQEAVRVDDDLLVNLGMYWDDPRALPAGWEASEEAREAKAEIVDFLRRDFEGSALWGVKDPRICRLLPLWQPALAELGTDPVYIVMQRHPLEVVRSLHQRDGLSNGRGLLLWLRHVLEGEKATRGARRAFISYDAFMADWDGTISKAARTLGLPFDTSDTQARKQIEGFIRPGLRHFAFHGTELFAEEELALWAGRVFEACRSIEEGGESDAAHAVFDMVAREIDLASYHFDEVIGEATKRELELRDEIHDLHTRLNRKEIWAAEQQSRVEERDNRLAHREGIIEGLTQERNHLIAAHTKEMHDLRIENARLHREVRFIADTWSWRLTKPFRFAHRLFLRALGTARLMRHQMHIQDAIDAEPLGDDRFRSTRPNPQLLLSSPHRFLPEGWVEVSYEIEATRIAAPFLFADVGKGYKDANRFRLSPTRGGVGRTIVRLPNRVVALRMDPIHFVGEFRVKNITIREISRTWVALSVIGHRLKLALLDRHARRHLIEKLWEAARLRDTSAIKRSIATTAANPLSSYAHWFETYTRLSEDDVAAVKRHIAEMEKKPLISVVMPTYNTPPEFLERAIESVKAQLYPNWELCIADDASTSQATKDLLAKYADGDERIKVTFREKNGHISAASNSALELAEGEFIALLDHDDELTEHALYMVAAELSLHPDADVIYSDEDKVDESGEHYAPYFKPDWSPHMFLGQNFINHLGVYRHSRVKEVGGFRLGFEGSQDYDLALRITETSSPEKIRHIPHVLYHWRAMEGSAARAEDEKDYTAGAAIKAVTEHLKRIGTRGEVVPGRDKHSLRVIYELPKKLPKVSLIIPTRNRADILKCAVDGIIEKNDYPNWELIIVDNGSDEEETLAYLDGLKSDPRIRVHRDDGPFNYSRLNNDAARLATGEIIGLINNDIEPINEDWLSEMVRQVTQPGVGIVGAKLYYSNDTLQHGGVIVGLGGVAGHFDKRLPREKRGYFGRAMLVQDFSAVTAACLLVPKKVFDEVGGLDEKNLAVAFNDVDFCLKVRHAGYWVVWTPYAELYHYESISRGDDDAPEKRERFNAEATCMRERWATDCENDPFYNPNLTLDFEQPVIADPPRAVRPWNDYIELERTTN